MPGSDCLNLKVLLCGFGLPLLDVLVTVIHSAEGCTHLPCQIIRHMGGWLHRDKLQCHYNCLQHVSVQCSFGENIYI